MAETPEYYSDAVNISLAMPWTVALTFALRPTKPDKEPEPKAIIRMSPEHAKVTAMLLRKQIKDYESKTQTFINLPGDLYKQLNLDSVDW
jgi:hypothetical protein